MVKARVFAPQMFEEFGLHGSQKFEMGAWVSGAWVHGSRPCLKRLRILIGGLGPWGMRVYGGSGTFENPVHEATCNSNV